MKTTADEKTVRTAISEVNDEHGYKIELNNYSQIGKYFNFTIKSPSKIPGARVSWSGRNLAKASWHAHGFIMDKIFELDPDCKIISMGKTYLPGFEWEDKNIGSYYRPCYFSQTSIL